MSLNCFPAVFASVGNRKRKRTYYLVSMHMHVLKVHGTQLDKLIPSGWQQTGAFACKLVDCSCRLPVAWLWTRCANKLHRCVIFISIIHSTCWSPFRPSLIAPHSLGTDQQGRRKETCACAKCGQSSMASQRLNAH